ncbi:MAG: matrixin family metalloprotease [Ruminococcaceae bacterium]|nr:matrixin family metalloprotease [Oscillospiraceae bacterium]
MVFLTVPLAKADIIISLQIDEEKNDAGLEVANAGQTRGTYNISYWYSDSNSVGYWSSIPTVHYCRMSGTSYFTTAITNGVIKWRNALGISISSSPADDENLYLNDNLLQFYQGSVEELEELGIFDPNKIADNNVIGYTTYSPRKFDTPPVLAHTLNKNGTIYNCYRFRRVRGFIRDFGTNTTKYNYVCTHEIGHALGWQGHSHINSDVMYAPYNAMTTLTDREITHLCQIYDLFY